MDGEALNRQLLDRIQALEQEGLIDSHFRLCHSLKKDSGLFFFVDLVPIFFADVRTVITQMTTTLNQDIVNFHDMYEYGIKLKGSAACIGALRMRKACSNLHRAIDNRSKDWCRLALNDVKDEYHNLQSQLDIVMQLERDIISKEICQP